MNTQNNKLKFLDQTKQWDIDQELSTRISKVYKIKHNGSKKPKLTYLKTWKQ